MAQSDSDDFEVVDSSDIARQIIADKKPDLAKIRTWLLPTEYTASSSEYRRHLSSQAPGTGEWIRETSQFRQWHASDDHASIWIKAVPGAGKSVVAASMVDSLACKESVPVLYFFFRQIIQSNRTTRSLLRDWLDQLLTSSEILQVALWEMLEDKKALDSISTDDLWKLLLSALRCVEKAYIIVDALDEMDYDEDFLGRLNALGSFRPKNVKILMTSRPKQYLQRAMKDPQVIHVSLEEELVRRDISVFVLQRVSQLSRVTLVSQTLIHAVVCARSQGLFLYARLMLDQVADSADKGELQDEGYVRDLVTRLPIGLENMYNKMLFEHASRAQVTQDVQVLILQLVTQAARPLRLIELAKAVEASHGDLNRDGKDIVRTACGPLLEIMEDEVVQILHHSFTEFLLNAERLNASRRQFPVIAPMKAHRDIAKSCLARLQSDAFQEFQAHETDEANLEFGYHGTFDFKPIFLKYPLVEYAAKKWTYHAKQYDVVDLEFFEDLSQFCDPTKPSYIAWLQIMADDYDAKLASHKVTALHVAAAFGLTAWAEHLVKFGGLNELDGTSNTPLFWAARSGHHDVVDLLLKAGAQPDQDGYDGLKPFHEAASRNHWMVAKLLLNAGVSPLTPKTRDIGRRCGNAPTSVGHSPLRYASKAGHTETVMQMIPFIENNEDLEDALNWAAAGGHSKLLEALLDHSEVSPDGVLSVRHESVSVTTGGETALMLAAKSLDPDCVRLLLERGADVGKTSLPEPEHDVVWSGSRRSSAGSYPLHSLVKANVTKESESAAKRIFEMLMAAGAELEARDQNGNTPLLSVLDGRWSSSDMPHTITMLLNAGANAFAENDQGETLLHKTCSQSSNLQIAQKLLELKVSPLCRRSSDGATPLHAAMANIHIPEEMSRLLIEHGADINALDADGNTPLLRSCKNSSIKQKEVIDFLVKAGADPNVQNNLGQTCLHVFRFGSQSYNQNEVQFQSIVCAGANLELSDREGKTVLLAAIEQSNDEKVEALFKYGNPVLTARTFLHGKTALHLACHTRNAIKIIQTLVNHGADIVWTDNNGNTTLHEIASFVKGFPEEIALVDTLLSLGVPVHARNNKRRTALHVVPEPTPRDAGSSDKPTRQTLVSILRFHCPDLDVNIRDIDGYTPLHLAAASSESITFSLLQAGAHIDIKAHDLRTPLHCAARARQSSIVSMLLHQLRARGAPNAMTSLVNAADINGRTPLHDACRSGRPETVELLLGAGADVMLKDKKSNDTLSICAEFMEENNLWSCLRNGTALADEFRPCAIPSSSAWRAPEDTLQHDTARIAPIVSLLLRYGTEDDYSRSSPGKWPYFHRSPAAAAVAARDTHMALVLQEQAPKAYNSFEAKQLLYATEHAAAILESYNGDGPMERPANFVIKVNDAIMDALMKKGVDFDKIESRDSEATTALHVMVAHGLTEKMRKVAEQAKLVGHALHSHDADPLRPLLHAACERPLYNMEMLKLLVEIVGVDVSAHLQVKEQADYEETGNLVPGPTALHILAKGDYWWQVGAIQFLIENGAEIDCLDDQDQTPLEIASTRLWYCSAMNQGFFRPQCLDMLLKLGADPNRMNKQGLVPLNRAGSDVDIIKVLLRHGADVNVGTKGMLMSAVESGNVETVKLYLEHGADCNTADTSADSSYSSWSHRSLPFRYPLLMAAVPPHGIAGWDRATSRKMVDLLLDHGAKVDLPVSEECTLLHYVFDHRCTSVLRSFIDRPDFDPNLRDQKRRTVFLTACKAHIDMDADETFHYIPIDQQERLRAEYVPPYLAIADSELHGSSVDYLATDNEGKHMILFLLPKWSDKIAKRFLPISGVRELICQKDNAGFSPLHYALKIPNVATCQCFIDEGKADILEPDPNGDTALHHLSRCRWVSWLPKCQPLMEQYVRLGGDINARNKKGETAIFDLVTSCNPTSTYQTGAEPDDHDAFAFFVAKKANFKAANNNGETALHYVSRRPVSDSRWSTQHTSDDDYNSSLFKKLVELGCDPLQEDSEGRTALDVAASMGNEGILKLYQRKRMEEPSAPYSDSDEDIGF